MKVFNDPAHAAQYDKSSPNSMIGYDALYETCLAVLAGHQMKRLLVVGAGTGKETILLKKRYPELEVIGIDPSEPMLEVAREKLKASGLEADLRQGRLEEFEDLQELEAVLMIGVLHHLDSTAEQQALIAELGRRMRPGGLLIFGSQVGPMSDPLRRKVWEQRWRDNGMGEEQVELNRKRLSGIVALESDLLAEWLAAAGFEHQERVFSTLFFEVWGCLRG